jgi:UDP-4-amino-4,6-dideoxy-N-acetyl-beta-L-altrosamine N-acetyltransferase
MEIADTEKIIKWRNSDWVKPYFIYQKDLTKEDHLCWLKEKVAAGKVAQFIIEETSSHTDIGSVYLRDIDPVHKKAEFGIFIGEESAQGKGYGTCAAKLILNYAFCELGLHKVFLRVYEDNVRAIASYQKAGFQQEALLKDDVFVNGKFHNIVLMGIINSKEKS